MHSLLRLSTLPFVLTGALAGCAASGDPQDQVANEAATGSVDAADAGYAYTYYALAPDLRKCPSPMCGGWFLKELNHSTTKCFDGTATACYVPALDWSEAGLSDAYQAVLLDAARTPDVFGGVYAIVRGRLAKYDVPTFAPDRGRFVISEGWVAEGETSSTGLFVKIEDNGMRCLVAPCRSMDEWTLNMTSATDIAGVDFTQAKLSPDQIEECRDAIASPDGLLVAGARYTVYGQAGNAPGRTASAAYYRLGSIEK
jgi:hypothetical protein